MLFRDGQGGREEPYETVVIDVDDEFSGTVIDKMAMRKARDDRHAPVGRRQDPPDLLGAVTGALSAITASSCPTPAGTGIMNRLFEKYGPYKGPIAGRRTACLSRWSRGRRWPMR